MRKQRERTYLSLPGSPPAAQHCAAQQRPSPPRRASSSSRLLALRVAHAQPSRGHLLLPPLASSPPPFKRVEMPRGPSLLSLTRCSPSPLCFSYAQPPSAAVAADEHHQGYNHYLALPMFSEAPPQPLLPPSPSHTSQDGPKTTPVAFFPDHGRRMPPSDSPSPTPPRAR